MNVTTPAMSPQQLKVHLVNKYNVLKLVIARTQMATLVNGETDITLKGPEDWMNPKFYNLDGSIRNYDYILFVNGFDRKSAYMIIEYMGLQIVPEKQGLNWFAPDPTRRSLNCSYKLFLADIVCKGNLDQRHVIPLVYPKCPQLKEKK